MSERLEKEVWEIERCAGCGMCISACSKRVLSFNDEMEHPKLEVRDKILGLSHSIVDTCFFCKEDCAESCPRLEEDWGLRDMLYTVSARTTRKSHSGAPNDVIADLLSFLMSNGYIDGAIVTDVDKWTLKPKAKVATTIKEVMESAGNQYIWSPTLTALYEAVQVHGLERLAIVGTPCVAQAIRKVQGSANEGLKPYKNAIQLVIGVFCPGIFTYDIISKYIVEKMKIPLNKIIHIDRSLNENKFIITFNDSSIKTIPLPDVAMYTRKGCARCTDFLAEMADISIGDIGSKEGYCTVIARSQRGLGVINYAVWQGFLELDEEVDLKTLEVVRRDKERKKRVQMFDSLYILMLDALADPSKLEEAKKRFGELYDLKRKERLLPTSRSGCIGCQQC